MSPELLLKRSLKFENLLTSLFQYLYSYLSDICVPRDWNTWLYVMMRFLTDLEYVVLIPYNIRPVADISTLLRSKREPVCK